MVFWQAVLLSFVEGITEFLPISSTGHMVLVSRLIGLTQSDFVKSFEIVIQLGAILAVVWLYWKRLLKNKEETFRIVAAFVPTMILGLALYKIVKTVLLGNTLITIAALGLGGIAMIIFEKLYVYKEGTHIEIKNLSYPKAMLIGVFQAVAVVPGVSRSLMTIVGGMLVGLSRQEAVEMSFMLAIPTMAAATGLDLIKSGFKFSGQEWLYLGAGLLGAFISAYVVAKWLLAYVQKHNLSLFGYYRVAIVILWLVILGV